MSAREIQEIIYQLGVFMFRGGVIDEGMVVTRYNIMEAKIEYYFIHTSKLNEFRNAKNNHDHLAHKRLGHRIDVSTIVKAQLFN